MGLLSLLYILMVLIMSIILARRLRLRGINREEYGTVLFFGIFVGLWSIYQYALPGIGVIAEWLRQRQGASAFGPMTQSQFVCFLIPSLGSVLVAIIYTLTAMVSKLRLNKMFYRWTYGVIVCDLLVRTGHAVFYITQWRVFANKQAGMFMVLWIIPFILSSVFSVHWLFWVRNHHAI